jgi:hypothetical protein
VDSTWPSLNASKQTSRVPLSSYKILRQRICYSFCLDLSPITDVVQRRYDVTSAPAKQRCVSEICMQVYNYLGNYIGPIIITSAFLQNFTRRHSSQETRNFIL